MMKLRRRFVQRNAIALAASAAMLSGWHVSAYAQSSVTLYGLISVGVGYVSNAGGKSQVSLMNGPDQLPRWGLKGNEDLGGGTSAIFTLENGFSITNGTLGQGGKMFGRQAYVGLSNDRYGTFTLGRQYDDMTKQLWWSESAVLFAAFGARPGDTDNVFNTLRFNNAIRYESPSLNGLTFGGMYAFSNSTQFANNSGWSFGGNYANGPLKLGVAMTQYNRPASSTNPSAAIDNTSYGYTSPFVISLAGAAVQTQWTVGAAATYDLGFLSASLGYSNVLFNYLDNSGQRVQNAEVTLTHKFTPAWLIGIGYIYTTGDYSAGRQVHYNQVNLGTDYFLSKRTDLFLAAIGQRAGGDARFAQIYSTSASTSKNQIVLTSGIRTKF
jgi:GBP family porin